jgi:predicted permease
VRPFESDQGRPFDGARRASWIRRLRAWAIRLAGPFRARRRAEQFDAELASHLDMHVEDNLRRGMTPEEARRQALIALGGAGTLREAYLEQGGVPLMESLGQDGRFALRILRKAPGFAATTVIVLALGIGANGAVFSLLNAVLLKPLNGGLAGAELFGVYSGDRTRPERWRPFSYPEFVDLRARNDAFEGLFAEAIARLGITEDGLTRRAAAAYVSSDYFQVLGASPALGRFFTADEERPGSAAAVAVVSDGYWRRLGMPADIVGRQVVVNARSLTIVGVAPAGFHGTMGGGIGGELWLPIGAASLLGVDEELGQGPIVNDRTSFSVMVSGTLKPGLSETEAQARLAPLAGALEAAHPETNANQRLVVQRRSRINFGLPPPTDAEPMMAGLAVMTISGMVLVVACLNLANLQLARGSVRRQEIAVRLALGAGRARIVRQLFTEGLLLAVAAGVLGLVVAWWVADRIAASVAALLQTAAVPDIAPDGRVLAVVAAACVVSALVFSFGPALKLSRADLATAMKQAGPLPPGRRRRFSVPGVLVGTQVALSLALLAAAGVFARASLNAASSDPGFPLEGGILAHVDTSLAGMEEPATRTAYARVLDRLRSLPGVRAASAASIVPFGNIRDARLVRVGDASAAATFTVIGSGYFETLGLPIVAGREFTPVEEARATEPVAILDETLAERLFPGRSPLGAFVELSSFDDRRDGGPLLVVGVVPSVRDDILSGSSAHVYVPYGRHFRAGMTFHVRTTPGLEAATLAGVRGAIRGVDPDLPLLAANTLTGHRDGSPVLFGVTLGAAVFAAFGLIGAALSAAGVYGLRAYLVSQRTREIGVRLALGATRHGVAGQLLKEGAATAGIGVLAGLALAVALVQVLRQSGMLYEVEAVDPVVFAVAPLLLIVAATAASYVPARRALRVDPAVALRPE